MYNDDPTVISVSDIPILTPFGRIPHLEKNQQVQTFWSYAELQRITNNPMVYPTSSAIQTHGVIVLPPPP